MTASAWSGQDMAFADVPARDSISKRVTRTMENFFTLAS